MGYFCERMVDGVLAGAGSDSGVFITDLKSLYGVRNRILNGNGFMDGEWVIYKFVKAFDESTYTEISRFVKEQAFDESTYTEISRFVKEPKVIMYDEKSRNHR